MKVISTESSCIKHELSINELPFVSFETLVEDSIMISSQKKLTL